MKKEALAGSQVSSVSLQRCTCAATVLMASCTNVSIILSADDVLYWYYKQHHMSRYQRPHSLHLSLFKIGEWLYFVEDNEKGVEPRSTIVRFEEPNAVVGRL